MADWEKHPQGQPEQQQPPGYPPQPAHPPQYPPAYPPQYPPGYPPYGYAPLLPPHEKPSSNIGWAIAAVLTFWPLAIPSFIYSSRVDDHWFRGDRAGAIRASADARRYGMIGVIIGGTLLVLSFVLILVLFAFAADTLHQINDNLPTLQPSYVPPS